MLSRQRPAVACHSRMGAWELQEVLAGLASCKVMCITSMFPRQELKNRKYAGCRQVQFVKLLLILILDPNELLSIMLIYFANILHLLHKQKSKIYIDRPTLQKQRNTVLILIIFVCFFIKSQRNKVNHMSESRAFCSGHIIS